MPIAARDLAERQEVIRQLESVVVNAYQMAALTATYLKRQGFTPTKPRPRATDKPGAWEEPVRSMLLNLGAMLKVASWEQAGLIAGLPEGQLPEVSEALAQLVPGEDSSRENPSDSLCGRVVGTWLEHFSPNALAELGVDLRMVVDRGDADSLLEALADYLWKNRHAVHGEPSVDGGTVETNTSHPAEEGQHDADAA